LAVIVTTSTFTTQAEGRRPNEVDLASSAGAA
jgi:hypothetical protein